jgi:hemin uptake protein HemP
MQASSPRSTVTSLATGDSAKPVTVRSEDLLRGQREIVIEHHGLHYRLLLTRNDRLILNK